MDIFTLSIYTIALAWTVGTGLHLCYIYLIGTPVAGVSFVANAFMLLGLSIFPIALGFNQSDVFAILFSNSAYSFSFCLLLVGIIKFRDANSALTKLALVITLLTLLVFIYFSLFTPSVSSRIETRCVLVVFVSGIAIYANIYGRTEDDSVAKRLLTLVLAMNMLYMIFRGWFAYSESPIVDYFSSSVVHKLSFLVVATTMLLTTISIVWMLIRRVLRDSYYSSITDELTGLYNRKGLRARLMELSHYPESYPIGVILADLDHFKAVNDTFGHEMGDLTIAHFGKILKRIYRSDDVCVRYGGEEFLTLTPNTDLDLACFIANRVKLAAKIESKNNQYVCDYTVSIGVTVLNSGENIHQAIKRADTALYRAKTMGRNTVVSYPQSAPQPSEVVPN